MSHLTPLVLTMGLAVALEGPSRAQDSRPETPAAPKVAGAAGKVIPVMSANNGFIAPEAMCHAAPRHRRRRRCHFIGISSPFPSQQQKRS